MNPDLKFQSPLSTFSYLHPRTQPNQGPAKPQGQMLEDFHRKEKWLAGHQFRQRGQDTRKGPGRGTFRLCRPPPVGQPLFALQVQQQLLAQLNLPCKAWAEAVP